MQRALLINLGAFSLKHNRLVRSLNQKQSSIPQFPLLNLRNLRNLRTTTLDGIDHAVWFFARQKCQLIFRQSVCIHGRDKEV